MLSVCPGGVVGPEPEEEGSLTAVIPLELDEEEGPAPGVDAATTAFGVDSEVALTAFPSFIPYFVLATVRVEFELVSLMTILGHRTWTYSVSSIPTDRTDTPFAVGVNRSRAGIASPAAYALCGIMMLYMILPGHVFC